MKMVNIGDIKARLSEYLKRVERGEVIIVARHNKPIAEFRPIRRGMSTPRPAGLCRGDFEVPDDFDRPLPDSVLDTFEGR